MRVIISFNRVVRSVLFLSSAVCNRPCNGGRCIKPNMCLCDEGSVRSACLPDDLRDSYNKDDEKSRQPSLPAPDRFEKPPSAAVSGGSRNGDSGAISIGSSTGNSGSGNDGSSDSGVTNRVATTTVSLSTMTPRSVCKYPCMNGGTCQGSVCSCRLGYSGENCADRK